MIEEFHGKGPAQFAGHIRADTDMDPMQCATYVSANYQHLLTRTNAQQPNHLQCQPRTGKRPSASMTSVRAIGLLALKVALSAPNADCRCTRRSFRRERPVNPS